MAKKLVDGLSENEFDTMTLVLGLVGHGWSFNKIGKVIARSPHTVKSLWEKALQYKDAGKLHKSASSEGGIRLQYVGNSQDLEELENAVLDRQMGKGRPKGQLSDY